MIPQDLSIEDFTYPLPADKIAHYPATQRDLSRLMIWDNEKISLDTYNNISRYLPDDSAIIFNNTKVIPARIIFQKNTGSNIEIFCLEPADISDYNVVMSSTKKVRWKCMVGGSSKWKEPSLNKTIVLNGKEVVLSASVIEKKGDVFIIQFDWEPSDFSFSEIIDKAGEMPLPPYIKRKADSNDTERYQTIFAKEKGSVAAPTAALHFTDNILFSLKNKNIHIDQITLHVGAGTFKPVKSKKMNEHEMHEEWMEISLTNLQFLLDHPDKKITVVGTTSARAIESLYWMGVKVSNDPEIKQEQLSIKQWEVYEPYLSVSNISKDNAIRSLQKWIEKNGSNKLIISTQIIIAPGYQFKMSNILVTNFHQPQSTLLLLVAAAIGKNWKKLYERALEENFRFLSYGDGCLLHIKQNEVEII